MSNTSRTIELKFNELHQPVVDAPDKGKLALDVHDPLSAEEMKHVKISGSAEAIHALGVLLIAISESPGQHVHLDEEADGEWFKCRQGFTLTIENSAKPKHKEKRTTDRLPPDWARG